jgi:hypothetical protein
MAVFNLSNISDDFSDEPEKRPDFDAMRSMFGPGQVVQSIRLAIQMCWMMLPASKKTPDELESTLRKIFDRAILNFREDSETFRNP